MRGVSRTSIPSAPWCVGRLCAHARLRRSMDGRAGAGRAYPTEWPTLSFAGVSRRCCLVVRGSVHHGVCLLSPSAASHIDVVCSIDIGVVVYIPYTRTSRCGPSSLLRVACVSCGTLYLAIHSFICRTKHCINNEIAPRMCLHSVSKCAVAAAPWDRRPASGEKAPGAYIMSRTSVSSSIQT